MRAQLLDSMELERERGITIKAQAVRVFFTARDGETYQLHLIDTPGHVDFTYEVSRSLAACEGALLVVDASQGVEAQTVANTYLAVDSGLELIPCLNKIDLPGAEPERVAGEVSELIGERAGVDPADQRQDRGGGRRGARGADRARAAAVGRSGGPAAGADLRLRVRPVPRRDRLHPRRRRRLPQGRGDPRDGDGHRGRHRRHRLLQPADDAHRPARRGRGRLPDHGAEGRHAAARRRHAHDAGARRSGALPKRPSRSPATATSSRWSSAACSRSTPTTTPTCATRSRSSSLNDAALSWEPETSDALGFGFRCGFLGLLHMDIVRERLEREYDLELLTTMPSVEFDVTLTNGEELEVHNPSDMPDPGRIAEIREPFIRASVIAPKEFVGAVMELCQERRGEHVGHALPLARARADDLRPAARRNRARLLRPAEVAHARLRLARLRDQRHEGVRPGQARRAARRRPRRRAVDGRPPRQGLRDRARRSPRSCASGSRASSTTCRSRRRSART